jgi:predicted enzyme related to lactoylglutathione lyase
VLAAGGKITRDIFSFPGGQRFHFKEPGGNELAVWSDSEPLQT